MHVVARLMSAHQIWIGIMRGLQGLAFTRHDNTSTRALKLLGMCACGCALTRGSAIKLLMRGRGVLQLVVMMFG